MKKILFKIFFLLFPYYVFAQDTPALTPTNENPPLFQITGGLVYSCIDLSHYVNNGSFRGFHTQLITHVKGITFLSAEYSIFPIHNAPSAWENVHTQKFDLNLHFNFATANNSTSVYAIGGLNLHDWIATRTTFADLDQMGQNIPAGSVVHIQRLGVNLGCGFTTHLYENISLIGDFRFCFSNTSEWEKVRIMDVMTTLGISYSIPALPKFDKSNQKKISGIGKKHYKWTQKGGQ